MTSSIFKSKITIFIFTAVLSAAGFYGCGSTTVTPSTTNNMSFSTVSSVDSAGDNQNVLVIDTVKIMVKDVKLDVESSNEDSMDVKLGPFVLFYDMTSGINSITTILLPVGTYNHIKFEVHKLNDNEAVPDPEFADINGRYSVIVKGKYLGNYFVYKSTKSAHQILNFPVVVPISLGYLTNITLQVKPYIWFIKNGVYLDPSVGANSNDIDNNIKDNINHNFKAFRDNDRNGLPD